MSARPLRLVVLVSGRGSNLRSLIAAGERGECAAQVVAVISDREAAPALDHARSLGIATCVVSPKQYAERARWDAALAEAIAAEAPDLVLLAGFMRIVGGAVLGAYGGRIVNVHPALLPSFPGMDGPAQALRAGAALAGCTVHVVDAGVDTGPILAQAAVPVLPGDDEHTLHARIQTAEHALLPRVVHAIATGDLTLSPRPAWQRVPAPPSPLLWPLPNS